MSGRLGRIVRRLTAPGSVFRYDRSLLPRDAAAGAVVAVMVVPQGLAYAALAGMPPITGLYAAIVPLLVYAALGSSPYVSVGPSAITALLVASSLASYAGSGQARYVALAAALAVLTGLIRVGIGLLRGGALANFLSQPVLGGFTSAAALIIGLSQASELLGLSVSRSERFVLGVAALAGNAGEANLATVAVGVASIVALLLCRRLLPRVPGALVVTVAATTAVWLLGLDQRGVAILGEVPSGLPAPTLPGVGLPLVADLLPAALTLALIGYIEAVSVAKALALRTRARFHPNQDLFALGFASIAAGIFRGFPIGSSLSRTAANYDAGAKTQMSSVVAAAIVAVAAGLLAPLLYYLPRAVLAAIVIVAVTGLFSPREAARAFRASRADGAAVVITFAATLLLPVEFGLLTGVGFSLLVFLYRATHPHMAELGRMAGTDTYRKITRDEARTVPEVAILRMDGPLYFMNAESFSDRVQALWITRPDLRAVVIDTSAITGLDATGVETLRALFAQAADNDLTIHLATVRGPFRAALERAGLLDQLADRSHTNLPAALDALEAADQPPNRPR